MSAGTPNILTFTGNRVYVEFANQKVGLIQTVRFADAYALEPASGVGDIHVKEYVPTRADHTITVSAMALMTATLRSLGLFPENGADALLGNVFDICQYSIDSGMLLRKAISCSYDTGEIDVTAHRILVQQGTFKALDVTGLGI